MVCRRPRLEEACAIVGELDKRGRRIPGSSHLANPHAFPGRALWHPHTGRKQWGKNRPKGARYAEQENRREDLRREDLRVLRVSLELITRLCSQRWK